MKKILYITFATFLVSLSLRGQNSNSTLYFADQYTQRMEYNASFTPGAGYLGIPFFGGFSMGVVSNISPKSFLLPHNGELITIFHPDAPASALDKLRKDNQLEQTMKMNILSFGFYTGKSMFWSFNCNIKQNTYTSIPGDFIRLAYYGMSSSETHYDFSNLKFGGQAILESALGFSMNATKDLRVGGRVKYLSGIAKGEVHYDRLKATMGSDAWIIDAKGTLTASMVGPGITYDLDDNGYIDFGTFGMREGGSFGDWMRSAGSGFGIDLGATYDNFFVPRLTIAAAVNDIGMMSWKRSISGTARGTVNFTGFEEVDGNLDDQVDALGKQFNGIIGFAPDQGGSSGRDSYWLDTHVRLSAEYGIFHINNRDMLSAGLSYLGYLNSPVKYHEFMLGVTFRPASWFTLTGNIAKPVRYPASYGFAMMFSGAVNFYLAAQLGGFEYAPRYSIPIDNLTTTFQMGLNFRIGSKRR